MDYKKAMNTVEAVHYISENKIPGVLVECGVKTGHKPVKWAEIILEKDFEQREMFLYDTFTGMTKPTEHDYSILDPYFRENQDVVDYWNNKKIDKFNIVDWCYGDLNFVKNRMRNTGYPEHKIHYIQGNVIDTLKIEENLPKEIAVLRLDTDFYDSSKVELECLYPRVVKGGVIIFDDYYYWNGQRKATDEYFKENNIEYEVKKYSYKTGSIIKT